MDRPSAPDPSGVSSRPRSDGIGSTPDEDPLTPREREVARLVAEGMTNAEIGQELFISPRTVESHVEHVKQRLGLRARSQVMAWVLQRRPQPTGSTGSTIGERARDAAGRHFVGRRAEVELLRSALAADVPPFAVLYLHGPGGVGKTALLAELAAMAVSVEVQPIRLDMRTIDPTPEAFLAQLATAIGTEAGAVVSELHLPDRRTVLLIDTLEQAEPLLGWLRESFVADVPASTLVVLAGRTPPSSEWSSDPGWWAVSRVVPLANLASAEVRAYLEVRDVDPAWHPRLLGLTHGHPLALSLVVDVLHQRAREEREQFDLQDAPDVVATLMARFVDEIPDRRHREALAVCAHARFTTEDLLRTALAGEVDDREGDAHDLLVWLRSCSFVEEGRYGVFPHDLARDVLDTDLRWRDRVAYEDLHRRVRGHIVDRIRAAEGAEQQRAGADLMFLHRLNPTMCSMLDLTQLGWVHLDRLLSAERGLVEEMTERHQGADQAAFVHHWLERQPEAFVVFRGPGAEVVGFVALLRLHEATNQDLAADPGTWAMWKQVGAAGRHRSAGDPVTAVRFFVDRHTDQAPRSPSQVGFGLAHVLHLLGPVRPAWDLIGAFRSLAMEPLFENIDYHRMPDAEFDVAGQRHYVFAHDWRQVGTEDWIALMGRREIDEGVGQDTL